ncbi:MAG: hypothetical protein ACKVZ0_18080 [Gemmatimonadales bacterium]
MTRPAQQPAPDQDPSRSWAIALLIFVAAALTLCWPMLLGEFLVGPVSDQFKSGYSYRLFAAEFATQYRAIPQWNPYIFGGLPYIGAAHGDLFYPTTVLRWMLPTDLAMNLGFVVHIVIAGWALYGLLRVLGTSWGGAVVGGLSYQLTGIVVSMVHAGHDGKLFVSALAPALLTGIVLAVRDRRLVGYGTIALLTGLSLQGHPQTALYLLVAAGIWGLFWLFGQDGPRGRDRYRVAAGGVAAVALGIGLYAIYALPMAEYVVHSPRAAGGSYTGWAHAVSYSLPPAELFGLVLPLAVGDVSPGYFGLNPVRFHSEYIGPAVILLAGLGVGGRGQQAGKAAFLTIAVLFLLVSFGGYTPFYQLWYAVMPLSSKLRAPGQAFVLVALALAAFAGRGAERLFRSEVPRSLIGWIVGPIAVVGLLAATGLLQIVAEDIARHRPVPGGLELAIANGDRLEADGWRLLVVAGLAGAVAAAVATKRARGLVAVAAVIGIVWADLWTVGRRYFVFSPPAATLYAADPIVDRIRATTLPYRVLDLGVYPYSWLMASGVPTLLGHHGNELRYFDDLLGGQEQWSNLGAQTLALYAVRYIVSPERRTLPGFHEVLGPTQTRFGTAYLLEADSTPPYSWVVRGATKAGSDAEVVATVTNPQFPLDRLVIVPDTSAVTPEPLTAVPPRSPLSAAVTSWRPGRLTVDLDGSPSGNEYLIVAENWYPDWHASVDGKAVPIIRANNALLSVVLPAGGRQVAFDFESEAYRRGQAVSGASLVGILALFAVAFVRRRRPLGTEQP